MRVKLKNFVTYTAAEFQLGPNLNMVIGPNGTGKSTLVCAICLGLGFPPKTLGRAKEDVEYIKNHTDIAEIEIELAAGPHQSRNPIIRRVMQRPDKDKKSAKNTWYINGKAVPLKEVVDLTRDKLSIQIDNLCQFLPQDRVVEFAQLSPTELLEETQKAAAPKEMQEWHKDLKELDKQQQEKGVHHERIKVQLKELQARQIAQRADVERMEERSGMTERLGALQKYRPIVQYDIAHKEFQVLSQELTDRKDDLAALQRELEPSLRAVQSKEEYSAKVDRWCGQRRKVVDGLEKSATANKSKHEDAQVQVRGCSDELEAEAKSNKTRQGETKRVEGVIKNLKNLMQQQPVAFDHADCNRHIRDLERQIQDNKNEAADVQGQLNNAQLQGKEFKDARIRAEEALKSLNTHAGQQIRKLELVSKDTVKAWQWVQKNQNMFRDRIYGPPVLECSVKDQQYAKAIESLLSRNDFIAFTVTNREDRDLLLEHLTGRDHLRLSDISVKNSNGKSMESWAPPCSNEELKSFGLDGWALDQITGPEPVLSTLCDFNNLHRIGITQKKLTDGQFDQLKDRSKIQRWVEKDFSHTITRRREYGANAVSAGSQRLKPARYWTDQGVNMDEDQRLRRARADANEKLEELGQHNETLKQKLQDLKTKQIELDRQKRDLEEEKSSAQRTRAEFDALPIKLNTQEQKLQSLNDEQEQVYTRVLEIQSRLDQAVLHKGQLTIDYANSVETLRKSFAELYETQLWSIEVKSDLEVLMGKNKETTDMLARAKVDIESVTQRRTQAREKAKRLKREVQKVVDERTEAEADIHLSLDENITTEELEAEIQTTEDRLGLLHEGDPRTIREFEDRAKLIEKLEEKVRGFEADAQDLTERIRGLRELWEPRLDALVEKISDSFSHNFSKIGCAGQVEVYKDESFENWAIRIQVKFR